MSLPDGLDSSYFYQEEIGQAYAAADSAEDGNEEASINIHILHAGDLPTTLSCLVEHTNQHRPVASHK